MPIYCYTTEDMVETVERHFGMGQAPREITLEDGRVATRDLKAEHSGFRSHPGNWPMLCDASGVGVDQIDEARRLSVEAGVPTDFTSDGRTIFTSPGHRKAYLKTIGMHDRDAGYGDPTP